MLTKKDLYNIDIEYKNLEFLFSILVSLWKILDTCTYICMEGNSLTITDKEITPMSFPR